LPFHRQNDISAAAVVVQGIRVTTLLFLFVKELTDAHDFKYACP
jgi:hypothetical protein